MIVSKGCIVAIKKHKSLVSLYKQGKKSHGSCLHRRYFTETLKHPEMAGKIH